MTDHSSSKRLAHLERWLVWVAHVLQPNLRSGASSESLGVEAKTSSDMYDLTKYVIHQNLFHGLLETYVDGYLDGHAS